MAPRSKAQKQFSMIERAKFNLKKALDRIEYEEEVILPGIEHIAELEREGVAVEIDYELIPTELPELPSGDTDA
jgi:hypothetical protein